MFNLAYLMILQLICESEKWLWESAYPRLGCWNPCLFSLSQFPAFPPDSMFPVLVLSNSISGKTRQVTVRHKETVHWNVAWAGAYPQIFWFCGGNPRWVESMLKACCCSKGVWFLTAVHYHFSGGKEQRQNIWASRLDSACICTSGLCWQEFWVLSRCRRGGSTGDWYHCGLPQQRKGTL